MKNSGPTLGLDEKTTSGTGDVAAKCACGCGRYAPIAKRTRQARGQVKGRPIKYVRGHATTGRSFSKPVTWDRELSEREFGWVCGLLEGEGHFGSKLTKRKGGVSRRLFVQVAMTDWDVISGLHELIPLGKVCRAGRKSEGGKEVWIWTLNCQEAVLDFMVVILPVMGSRRHKKIEELLANSGFERRDL